MDLRWMFISFSGEPLESTKDAMRSFRGLSILKHQTN